MNVKEKKKLKKINTSSKPSELYFSSYVFSLLLFCFFFRQRSLLWIWPRAAAAAQSHTQSNVFLSILFCGFRWGVMNARQVWRTVVGRGGGRERGGRRMGKKVKRTSPESARLGTAKMSCRNPVVGLAYGVSAKFEKCFLRNRPAQRL